MPASPLSASESRILGSTNLVRSSAGAPAHWGRLLAQAGADGGFLHAGPAGEALTAWVSALAAEGLPLSGLELPQAQGPLGQGKRLPHWASPDDAEERLAAIRSADEVLAVAGAAGAAWALLDAIPLALKAPWPLFARAYAERRFDPEGHAHPAARALLRSARQERTDRAERLLDAGRFALERLAQVADRRQAVLAISHGGTPWHFPSPRERDQLLEEFSGALLVRAYAPARLRVLETLGLLSPERGEEAKRAPIVVATDAVGLMDDLLPGLGPAPLDEPLGQDAEGTRPPAFAVVSGRPGCTSVELQEAVARLRRLTRKNGN